MSGCVIDACAVPAWCFEDQDGPATDALIERVAAEGAAAGWPGSLRTTVKEQCGMSAAGDKILGSIRAARAILRGERGASWSSTCRPSSTSRRSGASYRKPARGG